jgi:SAM-dependent methyltransferase
VNKEKRELLNKLAGAFDDWEDADMNRYRGPFVLGSGGEGTTIVAERIPGRRADRDPATAHVVFKLPVIAESTDPSNPMSAPVLRSRSGNFDRIRAEHQKREMLGNAPHMSQTPALLEFETHRFKDKAVEIRYSANRVKNGAAGANVVGVQDGLPERMPLLRTPLSRPRGGALVPVALDRVIPEYGCWSSRELLNWTTIVRALGRALWSVHGRGWAHGDIKPDNVVLYESRGRWHDVQLIDFGLVHPNFPGELHAGGTDRYHRPVRVKRALHELPPGLTPATEDLYALGITLLEVLLGRQVVDGLRQIAPQNELASERQYAGVLLARARYELRPDAYLFNKGPASHLIQNEYRVAAFRLCFRLLDEEPENNRNTIDVLRDLLAALDMRLVRVGDPETMFTKLLVGLGAKQPGDAIRATRKLYCDPTRPPESHPPSHPPNIEKEVETAIEWLRRGRGAIAEEHLTKLLDWAVARPRGARWLENIKEAYDLCQALRLLCGIVLVRERKFAKARDYLQKLSEFSSTWAHDDTDIQAIVAWWVEHLQARLTLVDRARPNALGDEQGAPVSRPRLMPPPALGRTDGDTARARDAAARWYESVKCDEALANKREDMNIEELKTVQDKRESSHEAAYGAIQLMRAHALAAQQQLDTIPRLIEEVSAFDLPDLSAMDDTKHAALASKIVEFLAGRPEVFELLKKLPDVPSLIDASVFHQVPGLKQIISSMVAGGAHRTGLVDSLWEAVYKFLLATGWTIAGPMPHENALALRYAAGIILQLFSSLEEITEKLQHLLVRTREERQGRGPRNQKGSPQRLDEQVKPYLWLFLIPKAHLSIDIEAALLGAATAALSAADAYRDLHVMPSAVSSFLIAGRCYRRCSSPEHILEGILWLSFSRNDLRLWREVGGPADDAARGRDEFATDVLLDRLSKDMRGGIAQWRTVAEEAYGGTAGSDPASFVGRIFFGRHAVELTQLTGGVLGVELLLPSPPGETKAPRVLNPGQTLEQMLLGLRSRGFEGVLSRFLELECGLGVDCRRATQVRLKDIDFHSVVGLDTMDWCVEEAKRERHEAGPRSSAGTATKIDYGRLSMDAPAFRRPAPGSKEGEPYDLVWMHDAMCRISGRRTWLESIRAVLRPGGYLMFTDWIQTKRATQDEWRLFCQMTGVIGLETESGYRDLLDEAGYEIITMARMDGEMRDFFSAMEDRVGSSEQAEHAKLALVEVIRRMRGFITEGPHGLPDFIHSMALSSGRLPVATQVGAAPQKVEPGEYFKDGFVGWLWVIASPRRSPAPPGSKAASAVPAPAPPTADEQAARSSTAPARHREPGP